VRVSAESTFRLHSRLKCQAQRPNGDGNTSSPPANAPLIRVPEKYAATAAHAGGVFTYGISAKVQALSKLFQHPRSV